MQPFLILMTWIALGALTAIRFGPASSWPVAMIFGPLWLPVALELQSAPIPSEHELRRRREHLGFATQGDR